MSQIKIRRRRALVERYRNFSIYLDGEKLTNIKNGELLSIDIPPGRHLLVAKIDWNTSNSILFNIEEGEILQFKVRPRTMLRAFYYTIAKPSNYLILSEEHPTLTV